MELYIKEMILLCLVVTSSAVWQPLYTRQQEEKAEKVLAAYDLEHERMENQYTLAEWAYRTNITDHNSVQVQVAKQKRTEFKAKAIEIVSAADFDLLTKETKRLISKVGQRSLPKNLSIELLKIETDLTAIYGSSKVCLPDGDCLNLDGDPGLNKIMADSTNYDLRLHIWKEWRKKVGRANRPLFIRFVELKNQFARLNGHDDLGDMWRDSYEFEVDKWLPWQGSVERTYSGDNFTEDVKEIYKTMEPLYLELHAYIRRKLYNVYGEKYIDLKGPLPAHLLSDMWGRFWVNLYNIAAPHPEKPTIVPSEEMKKQNYTVLKMFQTGDNFFADMGMLRAPESFWNLSMLVKPTDGREVSCHPTAWDFFDAKDFRIKMCARDFFFNDLQTIHHELGHIQYFQAYKHQPQVYREGANGGFHEAIGELMSLVSSTPSYLTKLGLLFDYTPDLDQDINFLLSQALNTVSTLPFHLVNDMWRWKIFSGKVPVEKWNSEFWKLKKEIAGVAPSIERDDKLDLDGTALWHMYQDINMIQYFTRTILQFQFLESLCEVSGHTGPLYRCDFSGSKAAGAKLGNMLALGSSKPWPEALYELTGTRKMSSKPLLKFFEPLHKWLKEENAKNGDTVGWQ